VTTPWLWLKYICKTSVIATAKIRNVVSKIMPVDTTASLADELEMQLERLAAEHREQEAAQVIAALCPVCAARREAKALAMRKWRAKRHKVVTA
jgi:hypothetical protein